MFENCYALETLRMENFLAYEVDNSETMFKGYKSLVSLNLSSFEGCMKYMTYMFQGCSSLKEIKIPNINIESSTSLAGLFSGCESLTSANLSNFDTSKIKDYNDLFLNCSSLESIDFGDDDHWDTKEGNYYRSMFEGCRSLKSLSLRKFKTNEATIMNNMFKGCSSLETLEINFNTETVLEMNEMFSGVINLRELDLTSFDTTNLVSWTDMWKDITKLNITIDLKKNPNILENKPDGIVIIEI